MSAVTQDELKRRLCALVRLARDAFEPPAVARGWLKRLHPMLGGATPLECAKSSVGAQRVKSMLLTTKYGGLV